MRLLLPISCAVLLLACGAPEGTGSAEQLPDREEARALPEGGEPAESEQLPDGRLRRWPASAEVEAGVAYRIRLYTHCDIEEVDFDGSFWEVTSGPTGADRHGAVTDPVDDGVIMRVDADTAVYESSQGVAYELARVDGPVDFDPCD